VVAAAIHLDQLQSERVPSSEELMKLTLFDRQTKDGHGLLHFFGFDEKGRQIYSVGCRSVGTTVERTLSGVAEILGKEKELFFIDTLPCVNIKMRIGGYLSRRWQLIRLGRPIVMQGTRQAFHELVQLVARTKEEVDS
jgi:hypothetical protein